MLPKRSIIQNSIYLNFFINAPHTILKFWGRERPRGETSSKGETSRDERDETSLVWGAKRLGKDMDLWRNVPKPGKVG